MSCRVGLSIGDSFAEIAGFWSGRHERMRWFLPKKSLVDGLGEFLKLCPTEEGGTLSVNTVFAETVVSRRIGASPAFLVTAGFEPWLSLHLPPQPSTPTLQVARAASPVNEDRVFGITERIRADGSVETPLVQEELEFLVSKLELLKIRSLAIGFLHATKNPEHELQVAAFFRERGLQVVCSHEFKQSSDESARWWQAILQAYTQPYLDETQATLTTALQAHSPNWKLEFRQPVPSERLTLAALNGLPMALQELAARQSPDKDQPLPILHLGLERFLLVTPKRARKWRVDSFLLESDIPHYEWLTIQPTQALLQDAWPVPIFTGSSRGFEPGPMMFGKALQPMVLDIFYVRDRLGDVSGFAPLINERSRPRILDSVFTLSKNIPGLRANDTLRAVEDLETTAVERMVHDVFLACPDSGRVLVSGALAPCLVPLLEKRAPGIKWIPVTEAEWAESEATALPLTPERI